MAIGPKYTDAINPSWQGELNKTFVIQLGPNSFGKGTFDLNVIPNYTEITSPQTGPIVNDRFFQGADVTITGTLQDVSEAMLKALLPEVFDDAGAGDMIIKSGCGLERDKALPLKLYRVDCNQGDDYTQHISADPWISFYQAVGEINGIVAGNVRTDLRAIPVTFRIYAQTELVGGNPTDLLGYQGNAVTLGVPPIA
jgi:hypothetical protein